MYCQLRGNLRWLEDWKQDSTYHVLRHKRQRLIHCTSWQRLDSCQLLHSINNALGDSSFDIAAVDPKVWCGVGMRCISGETRQGDTLKMAGFKLDIVQEIGSEKSSWSFEAGQNIDDTVYRLSHKIKKAKRKGGLECIDSVGSAVILEVNPCMAILCIIDEYR